MRHFLLFLLAPLMLAVGVQALAAGPKSGLDKLDFAGAHDQHTPVLLNADVRPVPFRGADSFAVKGVGVDVTEQGKVIVKPLPLQGPQRAAMPLDAYVVDFPALK